MVSWMPLGRPLGLPLRPDWKRATCSAPDLNRNKAQLSMRQALVTSVQAVLCEVFIPLLPRGIEPNHQV